MITVNLPKFTKYSSVAICPNPSDTTSYWVADPVVRLVSLPEYHGHFSDVPFYPDHMYVMHNCSKRRKVEYFQSVEKMDAFFQDYSLKGFFLLKIPYCSFSQHTSSIANSMVSIYC